MNSKKIPNDFPPGFRVNENTINKMIIYSLFDTNVTP